jgi:hypothetical protein
MRSPFIPLALSAVWAAGCAGQSAKPVEVLDERTGITLGALKEPIELVPAPENAVLSHRRNTFAYLGPVEWNRSGDLSYGMWIHIAPGNDKPAGDIRAPGAVALVLDEGTETLSPIEAPANARQAYRPSVSWGQSAYFGLTVGALRRMAASHKFELDVRAADGSLISFTAVQDAGNTLSQYLRSRGLTGD